MYDLFIYYAINRLSAPAENKINIETGKIHFFKLVTEANTYLHLNYKRLVL